MARIKYCVLLFLLCSSAPVYGAGTRDILILYDQGDDKYLPAFTEARYLENLLGHFNTRVSLEPVSGYRKGDIAAHDIAFYISYEKKYPLPEEFKEDFFSAGKTFCWINNQLGELDQGTLKERFGFHFIRYMEDYVNRIDYKNFMFPKGDENINVVGIDDPSAARVLSWAYNDKKAKLPYIIRSRNLYYIADSPFSYISEADRYIAFADLLHDIVGENHPVKHTALVRIEDINPTSDPKSLIAIAKYLHSKKVPFSVSLVPLYIDPANKLEIHLEDEPRLLSALKRIPSFGGTFVLHGYTHQYRASSTDDYEFWDEAKDKPVRGDSVDYASLRIEKGLKECFTNGIYPMLWETPHYFSSKNTHIAIKKYFSLTYDRGNVMEYLGSDQFFPYLVKDLYGQSVIPENLGYVHIEDPETKTMLEAAKLNLAVRDSFASFFFHPFINISYLRQLVEGLEEMGYRFEDVKAYLPEVRARDKAVMTGDGKVALDSLDRYILIQEFDFRGKRKTSRTVSNPSGKYDMEIKCPQGHYVTVNTEEDREPNFLMKIWRSAKRDVSSLRVRSAGKSYGRLLHVMDVAFIEPPGPVRSAAEDNDLKALKFSLTTAGLNPTEIPADRLQADQLKDYDIIVLPCAAARTLEDGQVKLIKEAVGSGSHLVLDGVTQMADELGIELQEKEIPVKRIRDLRYPDIALYWQKDASARTISGAAEKDYRVICVEDDSNLPLVVSGVFGKGDFIYFSALFDPVTDRGYSRFPFFIEMLDSVFACIPVAGRKISEMYFDPGMRQYISIEKLVKLWRQYGIKTVYAGGWHVYDKYSYDYQRLVRTCHENGLLVYCWLEPPMINERFYNRYPAWREKTALLKDAKVSWRSLMNLANPNCRQKAFSEIESLLMKYDWDGVNMAELYFESAGGPQRPENFTPMNETVRKEYKSVSGYDPIELFDPVSPRYWQTDPAGWTAFAGYRKTLCTKLKLGFLDLFCRIRDRKKDFAVMITVIDTTVMPQLEDFIAEDNNAVFSQCRKNKIILQVEDPSALWSGRPERYLRLGEYYGRIIRDRNRLVLDCNVLENHKQGEGGLPAERPSGEEIRQIAYNMDAANAKPAFYSEFTINENDFRNINSVLAREAKVVSENEMQWRIHTPYTITLKTGKEGLMTRLDNDLWLAGEGEDVIVPAGDHVLKFETEPRYFDMESLKARLTYISGELKWANFMNNSVEFAYSETDVPCYAAVSKRPSRVFIDSRKVSCRVFQGEKCFVLKLPPGEHAVKIITGSGFPKLVETSGVVFLSLVIVFGFITSILFLGLFAVIQVKRYVTLRIANRKK